MSRFVSIIFKRCFQVGFVGVLLTSAVAALKGWQATISSIEILCHHSPLICWFSKVTHWQCPGCGLTRSMLSFFSGSIPLSFYFHPMGPFLGFWICSIFVASFKKDFHLNLKIFLLQERALSVFVLVVAWGVLRNF